MASLSPPPPPAAGAAGNHLGEAGAAVAAYPGRLWRAILAALPSSNSCLLGRISRLFPWGSSHRTRRRRRRKPGLSLPLRWDVVDPSLVTTEATKLFGVLDDILDHVLSSMHNIQKNLRFWELQAEGTYGQKVYFMVFERGPKAFIEETVHLISRWGTQGSSVQRLHQSAAIMISERISILTHLQNCLASFLAQVYTEIDKYGESLTKELEKSLPSLLVTINSFFTILEESINHPREIYESDHFISLAGWNSCAPLFEKLPEVDHQRSQWTDTEIRDATSLIYQNLDRLDSYTSFTVSKCKKPHRMNLHWLSYTCGAVGLSLCTVWLVRHSRLMGSSDIDNWVRESKELMGALLKSHIEQPLFSIRDEPFETFRRRHKGVSEHEEVLLTAISLHRYEKELIHPLQNLIGRELPRALLIQVQKLKFDLETAMLELDQILRANGINFAISTALPAFFLSIIVVMLARTWIRKDKRAEGRGMVALIQRRLLVIDVEKKITHLQMCMDQGQEEDARRIFGLVLYNLDRLYKVVEEHAKTTGEWESLKDDIMDLGKPGLGSNYKLALTSRIKTAYSCMLPPVQRR